VPFFSNADIPLAYELLSWVQNFLVEPHPSMRRSANSTGEPICPFAKAVLNENALYMVFHREVNGKSTELIESIVLGYREPFKKATPFHPAERLKKALLVVFPEIPAEETEVLDLAHAAVKSQFVREGLMLAQCHARCDGRSVHNRALKVYTSPYPMFVMRHMAIHDILFLEDDESWFSGYDLRFGSRFKEPDKLEECEKPLLEIYRRAKTRYLR
jgi:heptaprenyl diphosphate synthase